jgi:nucleolar protein 58
MARMVATKAALSIRVDALTDADGKSEESSSAIGIQNRIKLESRLRALEHQSDLGTVNRFSQNGNKQQARFSMTGDAKTYNTKADSVDFVSTQRDDPMEAAVKAVLEVKEDKKKAKEEKKAKKKAKEEGGADKMDVDGEVATEESKKEKKEKKRKQRESEVPPTEEESPRKVRFSQSIALSTPYLEPSRRKLRKSARQERRPRRPKKLPLYRAIHRKRRRKSRNDARNYLHTISRILHVYILLHISIPFCATQLSVNDQDEIIRAP